MLYSETNYWHRCYYIEITAPDGKVLTYDSLQMENAGKQPLDIKFSVEYSTGITPKFSLDILGLSKETIDYLTVWDSASAVSKRMDVRLYAGYEKNGGNILIAQGMIFSAMPTSSPPEIWFHIECISNCKRIEPMTNPNYNTPTSGSDEPPQEDSSAEESHNLESDGVGKNPDDDVKDTANATANAIEADKVEDRRGDVGNKTGTVATDVKGKTAVQTANELKDKNNVKVAVQTKPLKPKQKGKGQILVIADSKPKMDVKGTLSVENGMIELSDIKLQKASATRLLDTTFQMLDIIRVESTLIPDYSGLFLIDGVLYEGHFRGNNWFQKLSLTKIREQNGQ
jgi:hypothetical protein